MKANAFFLFTLLFFTGFGLQAQNEIVIAGQVVDGTDKKPIGDVSVSFPNTSISASTDSAGYFTIRSNTPQAKIQFSFLGYKTKVKKLRKPESQWIYIKLREQSTLLNDLIIISSGNYTNQIVESVLLNKNKNNPENNNLKYILNEKTEASITEVSENGLTGHLFKSLKNNTILSQDSTLLLPVMSADKKILLEKRKTKLEHEQYNIILPNQTELAKEFSNKLPNYFNFYDDYIFLFGKNFLSPLAKSARRAYYYEVRDSSIINKHKQYTVAFKPKDKRSSCFVGQMRIDSGSYALIDIEAQLSEKANINFLKNISFKQDFKKNQNYWEYNSSQTTMNIEILNNKNKKRNSLFIVKRTIYSQELYYHPLSDSKDTTEQFELMLDSIKHTRLMRNAGMLTDIALNRYIHIGKFDWGPLTQVATYNDVEGNKFTIGGRTGESLCSNFTIGGYSSYSIKDETWKFGYEIQYRFKNERYAVLALKMNDNAYQTDYNLHNEILNEGIIGNGIAELPSAIFQSYPEKVNRRQIVDLSYEKQQNNYLQTHFSARTTKYFSNETVPFETSNNSYEYFNDYRLTADFRFSIDQRVLDEYFHRVYIYNQYPVIHFAFEVGHYELDNISNNYLKLHILERQKIPVSNIGKLNYSIETGYILGKVPFSLLEISSGQRNYGVDKLGSHLQRSSKTEDLGFQLLSVEHYAADAYINFDGKFITNGIIFNHIPIIRSLKLREILSTQLYMGSLRNEHTEVMDLPSFLNPMNAPYLVIGAGIANIFKVLSAEYLLEMPETTNPNNIYWGLRLNLYLDI